MLKINKNYQKIKKNYIFTEISNKKDKYLKENQKAKIIDLGIGDVTLPLGKNFVKVMEKALAEQAHRSTFKGYPPENGYDFLKDQIIKYYKRRNVELNRKDVFVSNGACCDVTNILDLFNKNTTVIANPTYPAYFDSNFLQGNSIILESASVQNDFVLNPKNLNKKSYLIYLCSPNNPTGTVFSKNQLKQWVDFALKTKSIIIFDCAYESFIDDVKLPHFIYEIPGAKNCAVEIASFSKMAGFTNLRCSWTVVPTELKIGNQSLNNMWERRQCTKFNGVPYLIQKGAEYALSEEGFKECKKNIDYYKKNLKILLKNLKEVGIETYSSQHTPYVWFKCPNKYTSWEFFDILLTQCQIVGIPGVGFGSAGEGFFRFSAFGRRKDIIEACKRLKKAHL